MMMRRFLILFVGFGLLFPLFAQEEPETPASPPEAVKEESESTNRVAATKVDFLVSTGLEYEDEQDLEEAERAYLRALETDPENGSIQFRLATLYVRMSRYADAIALFEEILLAAPDNWSTHNNLSWCYSMGPKVRNAKKALNHAREALLVNPMNPSIWDTLAEAYYVAGDYERARRSAEHALALLREMRPTEEGIDLFSRQIEKINRAEKARNMLYGIEEED